MKLFELAGVVDFSKEARKDNAEKLLQLALLLEKESKEESERCFKLAEIFSK